MLLEGKIALITGGTSGIGRATAERFLAEGAKVIVVGREGERLSSARALLGDRGVAIATDLSDPQDIATAIEHVRADAGRLDVLVAAAGVATATPLDKLDAAAYARLMDVNCRSAALIFAGALPLLSDGASVVFVSSVAGRKGQPGDPIYAGSKGFIRAFARNLGTTPEILARGIRVNTVAPGPTDTAMTAEAVSNPDADAYVKQQLVPMKRWGKPEEVANAILFLASSQSSFITGAEITADGGMAHA
jgi:NAD(P)-dependent dehydrogenase (short-subunit alcohol dehydrogenase family)